MPNDQDHGSAPLHHTFNEFIPSLDYFSVTLKPLEDSVNVRPEIVETKHLTQKLASFTCFEQSLLSETVHTYVDPADGSAFCVSKHAHCSIKNIHQLSAASENKFEI